MAKEERKKVKTKSELRVELRARMARQTNLEAASHDITSRVLGLSVVQAAGAVLLYASLPWEPRTRDLWQALANQGKRTFFPRVIPGTNDMELRAVRSWEELKPGSYRILEPDPTVCPLIMPDEVDLVLVPGIGFDRTGLRLGRGGGYYDRLLVRFPLETVRVGLFFSCQACETVPSELHDQKLHLIVTERDAIIP